MTVAMKKQLDETLRDALLAYYLNKVVPVDPTIKALQLASSLKAPQDLYEYWLLDVLVSQDVPTTPVACAIASLQLYINRILMNMEPGYDSVSIIPEFVQTWRNEMHQYPTWAAHQKLLYFPATYLDPSLRNNKSDNFRQLENDLNQNRIQPDAVQTAVLAYLTRFEEVANLHILNGYIDGEDFANSTYYFIAKSRSENTYFWRSLNMAQRPLDGTPPQLPATPPKLDQPDPYAWSDWEKADVPISDDAIEHSIRPVWFNNRLFVIWAECIHQDPAAVSHTTTKSQSDQRVKSNPQLRLSLCYKKFDNSWSTPRVCLQGYCKDETLCDKDLDAIKPLIGTLAVQHRQEDSQDFLFVALLLHKEDTANQVRHPFFKTAHFDKNLTEALGPSTDLTDTWPIETRRNQEVSTFQFQYPPKPTLETTNLPFEGNTRLGIYSLDNFRNPITIEASYELSTSTITLRLKPDTNISPNMTANDFTREANWKIQYILAHQTEESPSYMPFKHLKTVKHSEIQLTLSTEFVGTFDSTEFRNKFKTIYYGVKLVNPADPEATGNSILGTIKLKLVNPPIPPEIGCKNSTQHIVFSNSTISHSDNKQKPRAPMEERRVG